MRKILIRAQIILLACSGYVSGSSPTMYTSLSSSSTGINFRNMIREDSVLFYYSYEYVYNGGGVAIGDINNDGLPDIYFSSTQGSNILYKNEGNFKFTDITSQAGVDGGVGVKTGVNMVDINNDGFLDIFICKSGPYKASMRKKILYINNKNETFTDKASEYGLDEAGYTTQAYFLDYDKDNDLDVFFVCHPSSFDNAMIINVKMVDGKPVGLPDSIDMNESNRLFRNDNGHFTDVSKKAGVLSAAFGLSCSISDFNGDGWTDIYVANDFNKPDFLLINNQNGTFTNKLSDFFSKVSLSSMGSDLNDINNDGFEDLIVVDMAVDDPVRQKQIFTYNLNYDKFDLMIKHNLYYQYPHNFLQLNNGNNTYSDISFYSDVAETDWSWAPLIADFDNDGRKDIYITNGYYRDVTDWDYKVYVLDSIKNLMRKGISVNVAEWFKQIPQVKIKNYFYFNNGTLRFDNVSQSWSDEPPSFSNGAAYGDLDNDGDLDMVVNNIFDEAFVMRNNMNDIPNVNSISFRILASKDSKREVYGTIVKLTDENGNMQVQRYDPQRGFLSTMDHRLHFGLGGKTNIARAEFDFPSGRNVVLKNLPAGRELTVYESDGSHEIEVPEPPPGPLFTDISDKNIFKFTQKENNYIDFKREPLIPYKCSRKGPYFALADVNGDGREDIFVSGAAGVSGKLMLRNADGSFTTGDQACFTEDKAFEDNGVMFFDADGDKDNDLYVVCGGAEFVAGSDMYQDRLYLNDGSGNFSKSLNRLPKENSNGSCVTSFDYDADGDVDLFIGGGVMPGQFPNHDRSIILENRKGYFTDVTDSIAPDIAKSGIVNCSAWTDVDGDGSSELLLTGEWMPPMILKVSQGRFANNDSKVSIKDLLGKSHDIMLSELTGWWNCIKTADVDGDGDIDIILGNRGLNSKITADIDKPCTVYAKDFDKNNSYDAVLGYYVSGKCYPMYHRDQLIDQMPFMRKKFIRYKMYAGKTMDELFSEEQKIGMKIFKTSFFNSGILINDGNNSFHFENLPELAQLSNINDLLVDDFNKDGKKDLLLCGNSNDPDVSTGNYDCAAVIFLIGDGKGHFSAAPKSVFSTTVKGEVRKLVQLKESNSIILLKNNSPSQVFSVK